MWRVDDIITDWIKVATMLIVARWLSGAALMDAAWLMASLYTLIGYAVYHLVTRRLVDTSRAGDHKAIADDFVKVGTVMITSRLLSGSNPFDLNWIWASILTLAGFAIYHLTVAKYIQGNELTYNKHLQNTINDWAKIGTMLVSSRVLGGKSVLDPAWAASSIATLMGFTTYDMVTSRLAEYILDPSSYGQSTCLST